MKEILKELVISKNLKKTLAIILIVMTVVAYYPGYSYLFNRIFGIENDVDLIKINVTISFIFVVLCLILFSFSVFSLLKSPANELKESFSIHNNKTQTDITILILVSLLLLPFIGFSILIFMVKS